MLNNNTQIDAITGERKFYGFSFVKENAGGLGAALHAMLLAYQYAKTNNLNFGLVEEGYNFPRLNGCINDVDGEDKTWHSYFKSFPIIKEKEAVAVWKTCPNGFNGEKTLNGMKKIEFYSYLLKDIYILQDDVQSQVDILVEKSGFNPATDVVLHIRRTDKIFANKGSVIEASELPLDVYIKETVKIIKKQDTKCRVFLCTDDKKICPDILEKFSHDDIEVVWDNSESELHLQAMRLSGDLKKSDAWEENISALKNLAIMSKGLYLVGGRMSYFFRIAELLRYPLPTKNLKDTEKFGKAIYAEKDEYFANPIRDNRYMNFVSTKYVNRSDTTWEEYANILDKNHIIFIPDFMNPQIAEIVSKGITSYPNDWWSHAIRPNEKGERIYKTNKDPNLATCVKYAEDKADRGLFAYHFQRTIDGHYKTCKCVVCKLRDTMDSYDVMSILSKITGKTVIGMNEMFASK
jgi:hypothetical protein